MLGPNQGLPQSQGYWGFLPVGGAESHRLEAWARGHLHPQELMPLTPTLLLWPRESGSSPTCSFTWIHFTVHLSRWRLSSLALVPKRREGATLDHTGRLGLSCYGPEPLPFGAHQILQLNFQNLGVHKTSQNTLPGPFGAQYQLLLAEASGAGTLWSFCLT